MYNRALAPLRYTRLQRLFALRDRLVGGKPTPITRGDRARLTVEDLEARLLPTANVWLTSDIQPASGGGYSGDVYVHRADTDTSQPLQVNLQISTDGEGDPLATLGTDFTLTEQPADAGGSSPPPGPSGTTTATDSDDAEDAGDTGEGNPSTSLTPSGGPVTFAANQTVIDLKLVVAATTSVGFQLSVQSGDGYAVGSDGSGDETPIEVQPIGVENAGPTANGLSVSVVHGHTVSIDLTGAVNGADEKTLEISIVTPPKHGTLEYDEDTGVWDYTAFSKLADIGPDSFTFQATDKNGTSNIATVSITITNAPPGPIGNLDDETGVGVLEGAPAGTYVGVTASAIDPDGDTVTYSLLNTAGGRFQISSSGVVKVAAGALIDYESSNGSYTITVQASDGLDGVSTESITIPVTDVAPTIPVNFEEYFKPGPIIIEGYLDPGEPIGLMAASTDKGDAPNTSCVTYSLPQGVGDNDLFDIDPKSGEVTVKMGAELSFANAPYYAITVVASDGFLSSQQTFKVYPALYWNGPPNGDSVSQDDFADCWLIATITSLAYNDPDLIKDLISDDPQAPNDPLRFIVHLYDPQTGQLINGGVAVDLNNDPAWPEYSDCNGIWLAVLEQAFENQGIKLDANGPGVAIPYLTGQTQSTGLIWNWNPSEGWYRTEWTNDEIFNLLNNALSNNDTTNNSPVIAGSVHLTNQQSLDAAVDYGILPGHAYTVYAVGTDDRGRWVTLRDPYGYRSSLLAESNGEVTISFDVSAHRGFPRRFPGHLERLDRVVATGERLL